MLNKALLLWQKSYLWIALGLVTLVGFALFFRRTGGKETLLLAEAAKNIKTKMAKAENDAAIKVIKAETQEEAVTAQVEQIAAIDDEFEKAKALVALRKSLEG